MADEGEGRERMKPRDFYVGNPFRRKAAKGFVKRQVMGTPPVRRAPARKG